jgi:large subunit ribosomal protein L11
MSEKKLKVIAQLKVKDVPAGNATPAGNLGPALGQKKINAAKFCKEFNDLTADHKGKTCSIQIKLYEDQSYKIIYSFTSASKMIFDAINEIGEAEAKKKGVKFEKITGSKTPGSNIVGTVTKTLLRKVAEDKVKDMNTLSVDSALKTLMGTALSMGIVVTGD